MSYVDEVLAVVQKKNADQPEFLQAVTEVLDSLRPVIEANEELYRKNAILERITEPDRHVVAAAYGYARLFNPVAVIELSAAVRQGENILIDGLPRFITEPVRLGVVGVEHLARAQHGTGLQPLCAVLLCQLLVQCGL